MLLRACRLVHKQPLHPCFPLQVRNVKLDINLVKRGQVVDINNKLLVVLETKQKAQARGPSHYKLELKDLKTGAKVFERINAGNTVEAVELETKHYQFLYADGDTLHLMDPESFEEFAVDASLIKAPSGAKAVPFLTQDAQISVDLHGSTAISVAIPSRATLKVSACEPVRGNSGDSSSFKNAELENGVTIPVPDFVKEGDSILVDLNELVYRERVKA
ncbi:hypothetical protein HDV03_004000 [Kappamyces sp. JEL0829]|nr:hypothetical protein HDV03_004000 [Kappamyces sp. JEL0829]